MLSALAKYIFGGVMGDTPETTPMQYETREMNDWLLVDMPDQAIDDEDMDSESDDDDDILSAVPLLMDEDAFEYSQQIVLSYEANSVCDNTYSRTRKDFRGKILSASPKVQVHSGDKIQGNFLKNIETLSVETEGTSQIKANTNSTKLQGNSKSKRSKSKKSKSTKRFRKNKIQDSKDVKMKDIPTAAKGNTDSVKENSNDIQKDFHNATPAVQCIIPDSSLNNKTNHLSKIEDSVVPVKENSIDVFQDVDAEFHDNEVQENLHQIQKDIDNEVISDFSLIKSSSNVTNVNSEEGNVVQLPISSENRNISTTDDAHLLDSNDGIQKPSDDQVTLERKIHTNSVELKGNSSKSKKLKSRTKRFRKNKIQNSKDIKVMKDIPTVAKEISDNVQDNSNDAQKDFWETPQLVECNILDSSVNNNEITDISKIKDSLVSEPENSFDTVQDVDAKFHDKILQDTDAEVKYDVTEIKDSSNDAKTMPEMEKLEVSTKLALKSENLSDADDIPVQNDVCNEEIQESSFPPLDFHGRMKENSFELTINLSKSRRSKKSRKGKNNLIYYKKAQSTLGVTQGDCSIQENTNDTDNKIQVIPSEVLSKLDDESNIESNHEPMDVCVCITEDENTKSLFKDIMENYYDFQENIEKKMFFTSPEVQYDDSDDEEFISEIAFEFPDEFMEKQYEMFEKYKLSKKSEVSPSTTIIPNEGQNNSIKRQNNYTKDTRINQEQPQSKIQDVYSKDKSNDNDFWDIYKKIHEDSVEISDDEMDENFSIEMQASDNEMDESSDNETYSATDDDLSENSNLNETERRLLQLADNWDGERFLQRFPVLLQEESDEESDDNAFLGTKNDKFNSTVNWPVKNFYCNRVARTQRIFFTHRRPQRFELTKCFQFEPEHSFASQSLYYPSSYAIAVAQLNPDHYQYQKECQHNSHRNNGSILKHKKRTATKKQASNNASTDPSVIINTDLQNFINQLKPTVSVLPTKSAVVLEHVKELKPVQQAIQFEARKYLTRSQLNRQNRNYIYQSSVKTNRRRNLQRNHSGANNNRKCY